MKIIPNTDFFHELEQLIEEGHLVKIQVKGQSMRPLLKNGQQIIISPFKEKDLQPGRVILFRYRENYILHRIITRQGERLATQGDGLCLQTENITTADVVAIMQEKVSNKGKYVPCHSFRWRLSSYCWQKVSPIRKYLLAIHDRKRRWSLGKVFTN